jgi:hypothetical protein
MKDNRISSLPEVRALYANIPSFSLSPTTPIQFDDDALFLVTKSGIGNEKITYKNLKSSIVGNTVSLTGAQIISGEKTFADPCTFEDTIFMHEVIDVTKTGDISGNIFVANTGLFENIGVGSGFVDKTVSPEYNLHVIGDSFFQGDIVSTGNISFLGDVAIQGASIEGGDLSITGNSFFKAGTVTIGDAYLSGNMQQTGDSYIDGNVSITEDLFVGEKIVHEGDEDTFIHFTDDRIALQAGNESKIILEEAIEDFISFETQGVERMRLNNDGFLSINSQEALGELSVTGSAYLEDLYITGQNGQWVRVAPVPKDESVSFSTSLAQGQSQHKIDFPKTFGEIPAISTSIINSAGGAIIPHIVSGVSEDSYYINFGSALNSNDYSVHTFARPTGFSSDTKTKILSFRKFLLPLGDRVFNISFDPPFTSTPSVSVTIQTDSEIIPYMLSGVTKDSYNIVFGSDISENYTVHTHATR